MAKSPPRGPDRNCSQTRNCFRPEADIQNIKVNSRSEVMLLASVRFVALTTSMSDRVACTIKRTSGASSSIRIRALAESCLFSTKDLHPLMRVAHKRLIQGVFTSRVLHMFLIAAS